MQRKIYSTRITTKGRYGHAFQNLLHTRPIHPEVIIGWGSNDLNSLIKFLPLCSIANLLSRIPYKSIHNSIISSNGERDNKTII